MVVFLQQLITGVSIGGIYALLAVGYALIYSVFSFTNFAFGAVLMVSAFSGYLMTTLGLGLVPALTASIATGIVISIIIELTAYRPMRYRGASLLFLMISAMGINILIENLVLKLFGANLRTIPLGFSSNVLTIGNYKIGIVDIFALFASCIALIIIWRFLYKTRTGISIRACAIDTSTSGLMGIKVDRVSLIIFAVSGVTAGIAGILFGLKYSVYPAMGAISNKAFIASVIGGLGSLPGAVIGGFLLGSMETLVSGYISATYRDLFSFLVMVIILMFMPNGLLGKGVQDKI